MERSLVQLLAMCLCHQAVIFGTWQRALTFCGWEGNRKVWRHTGHASQTSWFIYLWAQWPWQGDDHPAYAPPYDLPLAIGAVPSSPFSHWRKLALSLFPFPLFHLPLSLSFTFFRFLFTGIFHKSCLGVWGALEAPTAVKLGHYGSDKCI